jgi:hypothetical protein
LRAGTRRRGVGFGVERRGLGHVEAGVGHHLDVDLDGVGRRPGHVGVGRVLLGDGPTLGGGHRVSGGLGLGGRCLGGFGRVPRRFFVGQEHDLVVQPVELDLRRLERSPRRRPLGADSLQLGVEVGEGSGLGRQACLELLHHGPLSLGGGPMTGQVLAELDLVVEVACGQRVGGRLQAGDLGRVVLQVFADEIELRPGGLDPGGGGRLVGLQGDLPLRLGAQAVLQLVVELAAQIVAGRGQTGAVGGEARVLRSGLAVKRPDGAETAGGGITSSAMEVP